jgi:hypothetical protein
MRLPERASACKGVFSSVCPLPPEDSLKPASKAKARRHKSPLRGCPNLLNQRKLSPDTILS